LNRYKNVYKNGTELSGGEKQKILLARLFCKDADIFILDEFEKNLDESTKKNVFEYILHLDKTIIYVTHDVSNCEFADVILKVDGKQIIETTFEEIRAI
jgi:ABC-type bacteriocin/lantibiotic exporter with double-glycine peptidase domain